MKKRSDPFLNNGPVTAVGRVQNFVLGGDRAKGLAPTSCCLINYHDPNRVKSDDPIEALKDVAYRVMVYLKGGAGVKVVLDNFKLHKTCTRPWYLYLSPDHKDYPNIGGLKGFFIDSLNTSYEIITLADSLLESNTVYQVPIVDGMAQFIEALTEDTDTPVVVDLSELRSAGEVNSVGLVASGPVGYGQVKDLTASFASIFRAIGIYLEEPSVMRFLQFLGTCNDTILRGGFKRGIVCSSMVTDNPLILSYLDADITQIPGSHKKSVRVTEVAMENPKLCKAIVDSRNFNSTFWEKRRFSPQNEEIFANVCVGIYMQDGSTCLIHRLNLGQVYRVSDLPCLMRQTMSEIIQLDLNWRYQVPQSLSKYYRPKHEDPQVALDVMGLANLLRRLGITYLEFCDCLEEYLVYAEAGKATEAYRSPGWELCYYLHQGYMECVEVADREVDQFNKNAWKWYPDREIQPQPYYERLFTVEPAQRHSYDTTDLDGFTTVRGIWTPNDTRVLRSSDTEEEKVYHHGPVEVSYEQGYEEHDRVASLWQRLMNLTGRAHAISHDTRTEMTEDYLQHWWESPLYTVYYSEPVSSNQTYLNKTYELVTVGSANGQIECDCAD